MDGDRFAEIVELQTRLCKNVLVDKAREYAPDEDRLHNFRVAAALQDVDLLEACAGMMAKHTVSIYDMCGSTETFTIEQWSEKITDHINYLIILRAIVEELQEEDPPGVVTIVDEMAAFNHLSQAINTYFNFYDKKDKNHA